MHGITHRINALAEPLDAGTFWHKNVPDVIENYRSGCFYSLQADDKVSGKMCLAAVIYTILFRRLLH